MLDTKPESAPEVTEPKVPRMTPSKWAVVELLREKKKTEPDRFLSKEDIARLSGINVLSVSPIVTDLFKLKMVVRKDLNLAAAKAMQWGITPNRHTKYGYQIAPEYLEGDSCAAA